MTKLKTLFTVVTFTLISIGCSTNCSYGQFPPGAPIEYSYVDSGGQTVTAQAIANDAGFIQAPCNTDGSSFEVIPEIPQV